MSDRDGDVVELLETAKLGVVKANAANARAMRANLAVALRKAGAEPDELTARLSARAFAASDFLREMAWTADPVDPALFAARRDDFVAAMDRLIFAVDVSSLEAQSLAPARAAPARKRKAAPAAPASVQRRQRSTLATALARWLGGRTQSRRAPRRLAPAGNAARLPT